MDNGEYQADADVDPTILDLQHLGKYTAGDHALRQELLGLFSEQLAHQLQALTAECRGEDWVIATHTLKGAARAIGAFKIADSAEALEQLDPETDARTCTKLIERLAEQARECTLVIAQLSAAA